MARCQSCGMPMNKDPEGGGTEADGSRSALYCSMCYDKGAFIWDGDDVKAYQAYVVDAMVKDGWWRPLAWLLTRDVPKLGRWQKA